MFVLLGLMLPFLLLVSTYLSFRFFRNKFGEKMGYFGGFVFYWMIWCLLVPGVFLSVGEIKELFSLDARVFGEKSLINSSLLVLPLIPAFGYVFPGVLQQANYKIILFSFLLALVNGPLEELLWRGLYLKLFGDKQLLFIFYSSFGFAVWHFAPQSIFPNRAPGGQWSFVAAAFILGVIYSIPAANTHSVLMTSVSHFLFDFAGLGGRIYLGKSQQNEPSNAS